MTRLRVVLFTLSAFGATACGERVAGTRTGSGVRSVVVAPASAQIAKGGTITLVAAVTADPGVTATPLVWTSGDATKASVDAAGKVTGLAATPGVAICAAVGGAQGCASIIVTEVTTVPAQVSIQSVTVVNLATPAPIPPTATGGQLNVTLNVNANSVAISKVDVLVDGVVAATQTFTAAQAAALQSAGAMVAEQVPPSTIVLSFNSAQFDPVTFVTAYKNGLRTISARTTGSFAGSGTASTSTSANSVQLLFGNADSFVASVTPSGAVVRSAANATGFVYTRGSLNVVANPILYTAGRTISAGSIIFGNPNCQTPLSTGPQSAPLVAAGTAFTATLALAGYEFNGANPLCGFNATGEGVTFAAVDNSGNQFIAPGTAPANNGAATTFRIDNLGPPAPVLNAATAAPTRPAPLGAMPRGRASFWLNDAVLFNGLATSNAAATTGGLLSNGFICNNSTGATVGNCLAGQIAPVDAGVGGTVYSLAVAPGGAAAAAAAGATLANAATLAPSATNAGYCGVAYAADALGNLSKANPVASVAADCAGQIAAGNLNMVTFGVDRAPPTIAFDVTSLPAGTAGAGRTGASVAGEFTVTVSDTGALGNSGMLAGSPVIGTVSIRNPAAAGTFTAAQLCPVGVITGGVCAPTSAGFNGSATLPLVSTTTISASSIVGYYSYSANSVDAAGNVSTATATRVVAFNPAANKPLLTPPFFSPPLNGPTANFLALSSSNFDLWKVNYILTYGNPVNGNFLYPSSILNSFNQAPFVNTNVAAGIMINGFVRRLEQVGSACNAPLTVGAGALPTTIAGSAVDMAGNASVATNTNIPAASVAPGQSFVLAPANPPLQTASFYLSNGVAPATCANSVLVGGISAGGVTAGAPTSVSLTVDAFGPTGTFNVPFSRVDFYAIAGFNVEQIGSATTFTTVDNGAPAGRRHRFSFVWTPTTTAPASGLPWPTSGGNGTAVILYAIGVSSGGDGLLTTSNLNVGLVP